MTNPNPTDIVFIAPPATPETTETPSPKPDMTALEAYRAGATNVAIRR